MISRASSAVATLRPNAAINRTIALDLLDRRDALSLAVPEIVLVADPHVLTQKNCHRLGHEH